MKPALRRLRGAILRIAARRLTAVLFGLCLLIPALVLFVGDFAWESWATDGAGLILGATGAAFMLIGLSGRGPDWIPPD